MSRKVTPSIDILGEIQRSSADEELTEKLVRASQLLTSGNKREGEREAVEAGIMLNRARAQVDMIGRMRIMTELDAMTGTRTRSAIPRVRYETEDLADQTIQEIVDADPRLQDALAEVERAYNVGRAVSFARRFSRLTAEKFQRAMATLIAGGSTVQEANERLREEIKERPLGLDWVDAFAETTWRTTLASSYQSGRIVQAASPAVREVAPGWRFAAVGDADTRPNHMAANGLVASQADPVWRTLAPPLGFNCRCTLQLVLRGEMKRSGLITPEGRTRQAKPPAGAKPDAGFIRAGNPADEIYGSVR